MSTAIAAVRGAAAGSTTARTVSRSSDSSVSRNPRSVATCARRCTSRAPVLSSNAATLWARTEPPASTVGIRDPSDRARRAVSTSAPSRAVAAPPEVSTRTTPWWASVSYASNRSAVSSKALWKVIGTSPAAARIASSACSSMRRSAVRAPNTMPTGTLLSRARAAMAAASAAITRSSSAE